MPQFWSTSASRLQSELLPEFILIDKAARIGISQPCFDFLPHVEMIDDVIPRRVFWQGINRFMSGRFDVQIGGLIHKFAPRKDNSFYVEDSDESIAVLESNLDVCLGSEISTSNSNSVLRCRFHTEFQFFEEPTD